MTRNSVNKKKTMLTIQNNKISRATWHKHLDLIENKSLESVLNNPEIKEINLHRLIKKSLHMCNTCMKTNQKKHLLKKSQNWVIRVVKLVYINIVSLITSEAYDKSL